MNAVQGIGPLRQAPINSCLEEWLQEGLTLTNRGIALDSARKLTKLDGVAYGLAGQLHTIVDKQ